MRPLWGGLLALPVSEIEPSEDNDVVADSHSIQALRVCRKYVQEGITRALRIKQRTIFQVLKSQIE
jgi:hypothetical protein